MNRLIQQFTGDYVNLAALIIGLIVMVAGAAYVSLYPRLFLLGIKNLQRHYSRTLITGCAIAFFAFMITMIWTIVYFIELTTVERSKDLKIIITYKWSVPSQIPMTHANYFNPEHPDFLSELRVDGKPLYGKDDFMTWSFYGGTNEPGKMTPDNMIFFFVMKPEQIIPMMDDLQDLDPRLIKAMRDNRKGCLVGSDKLRALNKRVGERFSLTSINYKGIDLEFEIVGALPDGRYNSSAIMNMDYFNDEFDRYRRVNKVAHPLAEKRLNLIWVRVGDREKFNKIGEIVDKSPLFRSNYPLKVETASSLVGSFLEAYRDIFWGMKFLLVPAALVIMAMVMANAISITVRERRTEMAVMKVLGYSPNQILFLILGEAMLVGALGGLLASAGTFVFFNSMWGGIPFRIGFFPVFRIPEAALMWGLAIGALTAFLGSALPAWTARSVKVSEVFAKVA
jgi:putative ABC transport system permease protein